MMATTPLHRRTLLTVLAGAGLATVAGCGPERTATAQPAVAVPDPLLAEVDGGVAVLRGADRRTVPNALATADGSALWATTTAGTDTTLTRIDTGTGRRSAPITLAGRWLPQAVSTDGTTVALTPDARAATDRPAGRTASPVLVVDATGIRHRLRLAGNHVPEAFSADQTGLFVLEWLPAAAPDRYRVRVVDLATGTPGPLSTRNKTPVPPGAEEEMRGDGRHAVLAPDRRVLYTLYTHQADHRHTRDLVSGRPGNVHAFVHTLNLAERWAYCVDLPHPFGAAAAAGHTMALTPDGTRLLVAEVTSGALAEISTEELAVRRTATLAPGPTATGYAVAGRDRLFVGAGPTVRVVDLATLRPVGAWPLPQPATGLVLSPDGRRLHVGQAAAVSWHDTTSGGELGRAPVPGLVGLAGLAAPA
ncbi:YncE family protein [Micromonospora sp. PLK6-60]|uniref:YncE family protein n=1 Tax=Micromonospora sp. PLK6-60 TaxID=2873383 RepID=UPI002102E8DD|nr:hypothetical protein [Micromonospora sp. PLK6-60]